MEPNSAAEHLAPNNAVEQTKTADIPSDSSPGVKENVTAQSSVAISSQSAQAPLSTSKPSSGNSSNRGKVVIIGIFGVVLATIAFVFFIMHRPNVTVAPTLPDEEVQPTPPPTSSAIDTANWQTYTDDNAGFSLKYPASVVLNSEQDQSSQLVLNISAEKISDIPLDLPMLMGRTDALRQKSELSQGGEGTVPIGSLYGQVSTTHSLFEVCSVMMVKTLTFYPNDYRVIITLTAPVAQVEEEMPAYFQVDEANCGSQVIWNQDGRTDIDQALANHQGTGIAQEWFDTFDAILGTVTLVPGTSASQKLPLSSAGHDQLATLSASPTPVAQSGLTQTYVNESLGIQLQYPDNYRVLTDADNLSGWSHAACILYSGGQAYDIIVQVWESEAEFKAEYPQTPDGMKVLSHRGKIITFLNNTQEPANQAIISSVSII